MPQIQGVINSVSPRQAGNKTIYDVDVGGQVYSTFDPEAMRIANDHIGQFVTAEVDVKQNGQYQNFWFNGIPGAAPVQQGITPQPQVQLQAPPPRGGGYGGGGMSPEREQKIVKQSSMATAFNFMAHLYEGAGPEAVVEAQDAALALAKALYVQVMGEPPAALQAVPEPAPEPVPVPVQNEIPDW